MLYVGRNAEVSGKSRLAASAATRSKATNGDHSTIAWPTGSMPRRPARPVSWVYWPGVRSSWRSPVNLLRLSMTTERAGMLMPRASVSVAKTTLTRPSAKQRLDRLLERRHHARVVRRDAGFQSGGEAVVVEDVEVAVAQVLDVCSVMVGCAPRSSTVVSRTPDSSNARAASSQPLRLKMK